VKLPLAAATAATLGVLLAGGCSGHHDCSASCKGGSGVTLDLACGGTDLTSVILTGACNEGNITSPDTYLGGPHQQYVYLPADEAGPCHVKLVFATGFTFSTDVHFSTLTDDSDPQCTCQYVQADQTTIAVNNPASTCVDGGVGD
jgi:hypothetical protein